MLNKCISFSEENIPEGHFQLSIYIVAYFQFFARETVSPIESHIDKIYTVKFSNTKYEPIVIYSFKTCIPPNLGSLSKGKDSTKPLTTIGTP